MICNQSVLERIFCFSTDNVFDVYLEIGTLLVQNNSFIVAIKLPRSHTYIRITNSDISKQFTRCIKLFNNEKYQEKIPVSENGARLIQTRRKETARTISIKDVVMAILPLASTVAAWGIFSGFSMGLLSGEMSPWNVLIPVCVLLHSLLSGGYCGSFQRLASFLVLIPAFILLWPTVGNISILGVLVLQFGKFLYQFDKYQIYL